MSVDVDWASLGPSVAGTIRGLLNEKFSESELPGFIRDICVLELSIGSVPPEITIKDIAEPFAEFYEDDSEREMEGSDQLETGTDEGTESVNGLDLGLGSGHVSLSSSPEQNRRRRRTVSSSMDRPVITPLTANSLAADTDPAPSSTTTGLGLGTGPVGFISTDTNAGTGTTSAPNGQARGGGRGVTLDDLETASHSSGPPPYAEHLAHRPMNSTSGWEGMNVPYFHSAFATPNTGIVSASGLSTPRPRFLGWSNTFQPVETMISESSMGHAGFPADSNNTQQQQQLLPPARHSRHSDRSRRPSSAAGSSGGPKMPNVKAEDFQLEVQFSYSGDMTVRLRVELALNYPSAFFVTLPIEMTVSELRLDTVAVIAHMEGKVHVSLLADAESPLRHLKIKSQIGEQDKVSLTDVEKVEKFLLKEIQEMVERELVFPSYYTLLI